MHNIIGNEKDDPAIPAGTGPGGPDAEASRRAAIRFAEELGRLVGRQLHAESLRARGVAKSPTRVYYRRRGPA